MATFVLSLLMAAIGVALIVQVADGHGSVASARLLLGVLFLAAGAGRIYVERKRARRRAPRRAGWAAGELRPRGDQVRGEQGRLPRDRDGAVRRRLHPRAGTGTGPVELLAEVPEPAC